MGWEGKEKTIGGKGAQITYSKDGLGGGRIDHRREGGIDITLHSKGGFGGGGRIDYRSGRGNGSLDEGEGRV